MDVKRQQTRQPAEDRLRQRWILPVAVGILLAASALRTDAVAGGPAQPLSLLSPQEQAWLSDHPVVLLAPDADFPPIEFFDELGQYQGIAADYAALVEQRLGARFTVVRLPNWVEVLAQAQRRDEALYRTKENARNRVEAYAARDLHTATL